MIGSSKQVSIVGPNLSFTYIDRRSHVNRITSPQRRVLRKPPDQGNGPLQQLISYLDQIPDIALDMLSEYVDQLSTLRRRKRALVHMALERTGYFE